MPETTVTTTRETTSTQAPNGAAPLPPPKEVFKKTTLGKKKRKLAPVFFTLGAAVLGFGVWYFMLRTPAKPPIVVRYAAVDMGDLSRGVTATGTLQATTTVQVGSQVSGMVVELYADFNTKVKKGQLLAKIDSTTYEQAILQAQANLAKAKADLLKATQDEARQKELLARQLIAQSDYDASKNVLSDATASLSQSQASLKQAEANLGYTIIRSPISGVVVARNVDKGQTVAAGLSVTTLFVIAEDLTSMQVAANVDEADIGSVKEGQDVKFTVDAYPGDQFTGTVHQVRLNSVTTSNVVTYTVIINTSNPDLRLFPGMTATVMIVNASRTGVLRVPVSATRFTPSPELLAASGIKDTASKVRKPRAPGDTAHHGGGGAGHAPGADRPTFATVYRKTTTPDGPSMEPIKVMGGLSDGNYTEILKSTPELHAGDSVIVAAFSMSTATPSGSSPLNTRPTGGGGGGGQRGGR